MHSPSSRKIEHFWHQYDPAIRWVAFVVLLADAIRQIVIS
jgi:hypothetical protein